MDYFPHDFSAHDDPKLLMLHVRGGYKMIGIYWTMLEIIGSTNERAWPESALDALARSLKVTPSTLRTAIGLMSELGLIVVERGSVLSPGLMRRMSGIDAKRDQRRAAATKAAKERWNGHNGHAIAVPPQSDGNAGVMRSLPNLTQPNLTHTAHSRATDVDRKLADKLLELIRERDPKFKQPNLGEWAEHIEKLRRLDGRSPKDIYAVMQWCQSDEFWRSNILSAKKLREKFSTLYQRANVAPASAPAALPIYKAPTEHGITRGQAFDEQE